MNRSEKKGICRFPVPRLDDLPHDIKRRILDVQKKIGFIPNVFLILAQRPDEFRAFFSYYDALMLKESGLSVAEREMIGVAVSGFNRSQYCVAAHGAILRIYAKNPFISDQIAVNYRKADITKRQKVMLEFALKVAANSDEISEDDYGKLNDHGFTDEDIRDIGTITSFFGMANRLANLLDMIPNYEFFSMGR